MDTAFLVGSCVAITAMSLAGIGLPLALQSRDAWNQTVITVLTYATGGVFLGAGMLHMLPEAASEFAAAGGPPIINPYFCFCVGYLLVYMIEQMQPGQHHHILPKPSVLAVAQRSKDSGLAASICVVDVPPTTTYYNAHRNSKDGLAVASDLSSSLLAHPATLEAAALGSPVGSHSSHTVSPVLTHNPEESFGHGDESSHSHGHGHGHGHGHAHAHASSHGGGHDDECCGGGHSHAHDHAHGPAPQHAHSHAEAFSLPPPALGGTRSGDGWMTEGCDCPDHDHVHVGVKHKLVSVGETSNTLPLVLALLFSVHSAIAGVALGIQSQIGSSAVAILVAILGHKFVEALSLASSFVKEGVTLRASLSVLLVYCAMTPLGVLVGACAVRMDQKATLLEANVSGFAAGSFVFFAARELAHSTPNSQLNSRQRAALALAGVGCMAILSLWV